MKARYSLLILMLVVLTAANTSAQNRVTRYISKYETMAVAQMKKYQIPASVILGVSIIESGAGTSKLARYFHNHFGIKGPSKNSMKKLGYRSAYREYESDTASYEHFCRMIANKRFYSTLKGEADYQVWLQQMMKARYSTAPDAWIKKISATIERYKLYEYDDM